MKALLFTTLSVFKYIWMYNEIILGLTDLLQYVFLGLDNYKLANEFRKLRFYVILHHGNLKMYYINSLSLVCICRKRSVLEITITKTLQLVSL